MAFSKSIQTDMGVTALYWRPARKSFDYDEGTVAVDWFGYVSKDAREQQTGHVGHVRRIYVRSERPDLFDDSLKADYAEGAADDFFAGSVDL